LRPGRIFTWWALTSFNANARSSNTYQTGFPYESVASIAISVTPAAANQSAIATNDAVNEANAHRPVDGQDRHCDGAQGLTARPLTW